MDLFVTFILILHTATVDVEVAAYATEADCEGVAYVLNLHLSNATATCTKGTQE